MKGQPAERSVTVKKDKSYQLLTFSTAFAHSMPMRLKRAYSLLCLSLSLGFLSSCSNPDSEDSAKKITPILSTAINEVTVRVFARSSWQDAGFKVKAGDKLTIKPNGNWTGGQISIGSRPQDAQLIFCDANGCNGDKTKTFSANPPGSTNAYRVTEEAAPGGATGANTNKIYRHEFFDGENVLPGQGVSYATQKGGFGGADAAGVPLLDAKQVCFSDENILLGATGVMSSVLKSGWWYTRSREWMYFRDVLLHGAFLGGQGNHANVVATVAQLNQLIQLYENAKCEAPPQDVIDAGVPKINRIAAALDDLALGFAEHAYRPVYFVDVPAGNHGLLCRSDRDVVQTYLYGKAHDIIPKNDCAPATKNVLIMKVVSDSEKFEDNAPIVVGKSYETSEYTVQKTGWVFLKNNDADTGIFDNGTFDTSFIDVKIKRMNASTD